VASRSSIFVVDIIIHPGGYNGINAGYYMAWGITRNVLARAPDAEPALQGIRVPLPLIARPGLRL
jgi:hypothetical protein